MSHHTHRVVERDEDDLRRSQELFRALVRSFPNGAIFLFDHDLRYTLADGAGLAEVGLSKEMLEGKTIWEVLPQDAVEIVEPHYRAALAGETHTFEAPFGGRVYLAHTLPLHDERGDILAGMAVTQDITGRKRAEEALAKWAHIFEHAEWGVAVGSADGRTLQMMNPAYARMHGYTVEELSGKPIASMFAPGTRDELNELIRVANETGHAVMESTHIRKDGTIFPVLVDLTAVKDDTGKVLYRVANVQDITERKQAEAALRESEELYRRAIEAAGAVPYYLDHATDSLTFMGKGILQLTGFSAEEMTHRLWNSLVQEAYLIGDGAKYSYEEAVRRSRLGEFPMWRCDYRIRTRDGRLRWIASSAVEVFGGQGVSRGSIGILQDITERKQAEEALQTSEARFRSAFDDAAIGMALVSPDGAYLRVNRGYCELTGYAESELLGTTFQSITHPDDVEADVDSLNDLLAGAIRYYEMEKRFIHNRGHVVWALLSVSLVRDANGQPLYTVSQVQDITQRKRAEQALAERARLSALGNEVGIALTESKSLRAMLQRCAEAVVQHPDAAFARIWTLNEQDDVLELQASAGLYTRLDGLHSRVPVGHLEIGAIAGQRQPHLTNDVLHDPEIHDRDWARREGMIAFAGYPLMVEDQLVGVMALFARHPLTPLTLEALASAAGGIATGIKRAQTESLLREREAQYRSIFESTSDGLFINDLETGRIVDINPAAAHMHGYTPEEFRQLQPAQFIHPDSLRLFREYLETVKAGRQFRRQAVDVRKDGAPFHIEVFGTSFLYRGKPHALGVVRDITERVQAQQLLEQRVEERTRELSTLLDVSRNVASTLELDPLLGLILDQLKALMDYDGAALLTLQGDALVVLDYRGPIPREKALQGRFPLNRSTIDQEIIRRREPIIIGDIRGDTAFARAFRESAGAYLETFFGYIRSWMGVPLMIKEQTIGIMALDHSQPNYYTERHARLAMAIANQAAIAIENARLFTEVQGKAVLEERQRLARELHDSVTQSLYSLTLLGEAGRRLAEGDDARQAGQYLGDIGEIAQQALKEMRLLVYQLRPLALEREGLIGALQARLDSVEKRAGVDARFLIEGSLGSLPPVVEEGLFRIAQEALNNALKHAGARAVLVRLRGEDERVTLEVSDNGRGFDSSATGAHGGLGLTGMHERGAQLHGTLTVHSAPGEGTRVLVEVPRQRRLE